MKKILFILCTMLILGANAQEIPGVTKYLTNGRSGAWDMITDTAYVREIAENSVSIYLQNIDSLNLSGDTLFFYLADGSIDTVLFVGGGVGWWEADGDDITNRNTGFVKIDSLFKIYPLPPEAASLGKIATIETSTGQTKWTTPAAIVAAGQQAEIGDPSLYTTWYRDTTAGVIYQAHDTDFVNINHKLQIGELKEPAYNLEVTGTTYLNGNVTINDTIWLTGGETIYATGNGFIRLETGGYTEIKDVMKLVPRSDAPGSPSEGMMYFDSDDHKLKVYNGSTWTDCN